MSVSIKIINSDGEIKHLFVEDEMVVFINKEDKILVEQPFLTTKIDIVNEVDLKLHFEDKSQLLLMNASKWFLEDTSLQLQFIDTVNQQSFIIGSYSELLNALESAAHEPILNSIYSYPELSEENALQEDKQTEEVIAHKRSEVEILDDGFNQSDSSTSFLRSRTEDTTNINNIENSIDEVVPEDEIDEPEEDTQDDVIDISDGDDITTIGDDTVAYERGKSIDGLEGYDKLLIEDIKVLNLKSLQKNIDNIEEIDIQDGTENTLKNISVEDVLEITDEDNTLFVTGEEGDRLQFHKKESNDWIKTEEQIEIDGTLYDVWNNDDVTLNIDTSIIVDI